MKFKIINLKLEMSNSTFREDIVNDFIRHNEVINITKGFFILNNTPYWTFCIEYTQFNLVFGLNHNNK